MAPISLQFCVASVEDAEKVRDLVQTAFQTVDSRPDWTGLVDLATSFHLDINQVEAKIADPNVVTLMALGPDNSELVASIEVSKRGDDCGRLSMIAVDDKYQRGGVGRQVLAYAEDYCQQNWGVKKFSLNALSTRKALTDWYLRRGYHKTGETSSFPREIFTQLELPEDLHFVEMEKYFYSDSERQE